VLAGQQASRRLLDRYLTTGLEADLDEAVRLGADAVRSAAGLGDAGEHPGLGAAARAQLALAFRRRYGLTGQVAQLDQAIELAEDAVALAGHPGDRPGPAPPPPAPHRVVGEGLQERYARTGRLEELERSMEAHRRALASPAAADPRERAACRNSLGTALRELYLEHGRLVDLRGAIRQHERAVRELPPGALELPVCLTNLGIALQDRYEHLGDPDDLDRAIALGERAVAESPAGSPDHPMHLVNLGSALWVAHGRARDPDGLDRAVGLLEEALARTPVRSPYRYALLERLGTGLLDRYEDGGAGATSSGRWSCSSGRCGPRRARRCAPST
jgi:tetratricopeptide (TPR) repeat protein